MTADQAHEQLQAAVKGRVQISASGTGSLDIAIRLQDSAALTLIALELRALRQSFERGKTPILHDEEEHCLRCGHLASLHRVGDSDGGPGACRECDCVEFGGAG